MTLIRLWRSLKRIRVFKIRLLYNTVNNKTLFTVHIPDTLVNFRNCMCEFIFRKFWKKLENARRVTPCTAKRTCNCNRLRLSPIWSDIDFKFILYQIKLNYTYLILRIWNCLWWTYCLLCRWLFWTIHWWTSGSLPESDSGYVQKQKHVLKISVYQILL